MCPGNARTWHGTGHSGDRMLEGAAWQHTRGSKCLDKGTQSTTVRPGSSLPVGIPHPAHQGPSTAHRRLYYIGALFRQNIWPSGMRRCAHQSRSQTVHHWSRRAR